MASNAALRAEPQSLAEMHARKVEADRRQAEAAATAARLRAERAARAQAPTQADPARGNAIAYRVRDPERLAREPRHIIARVAATFGLTAEDLIGPRGAMAVCEARFAAIDAVHQARPDLSNRRIGRAFGGRDHATIAYALARNAVRGVPRPPEAPAP